MDKTAGSHLGDLRFGSYAEQESSRWQLLHDLAQIMPEAIKVGILREQGLAESAIAAELGIPRTTLRSRLAKAREQLAQEYPDVL